MSERRARADAQRNLERLLQTAKEIFAVSGVDAPVREIAEQAGVGIGTVYRHFPRRADLIAAVFSHEIDACADVAQALAAENPPFQALSKWMRHFVNLSATKRGLAKALYSGDPAFDGLPTRRDQRLVPAFKALFDSAATAGEIRADVDAEEFLNAAAYLCVATHHTGPEHVQRMVDVFVDGLRHGAPQC